MKSISLNKWIRVTLFLCGILLIFVLFVPIWKIDLAAPQYPEGLTMNINANGLGGNIDIINGLNHYIGMKTLHNADFIEFKILPILISIFAVFFFIVAFIKNRKLMYVLFVSFLSFGTIAMIDFWKWEYNYGHNLDPHAAIIVPGMAYQPPLIGYKQLLNFGAYSIPDIGGWLFIIVGIILLLCVIMDIINKKKIEKLAKGIILPITCLVFFSISGCSTEPDPIRVGIDNCHYCKMTIVDKKYSAEVMTKKGKIFKYDDSHCLLSEIAEKGIEGNNIKEIYFTDFCNGHSLIKGRNAFFFKSNQLQAPMGGNMAVFLSHDSLNIYNKQLGGEEVLWNQIMPVK